MRYYIFGLNRLFSYSNYVLYPKLILKLKKKIKKNILNVFFSYDFHVYLSL